MGDFSKINGATPLPMRDGKSIKLYNRATNGVKGKYEDWMMGGAFQRPFHLAELGTINPQQLKQYLDSVTRVSGVRGLSWGSEAWWESLKEDLGLSKLIHLLAMRADSMADLPPEEKNNISEDTVYDLMNDEIVRPGLLTHIAEVMHGDPNFRRPPRRGVDD